MARFDIFSETNLIYGIAMLTAIATIFAIRDFIACRNVIIYVDNANTKDSLAKGNSNTPAIGDLIRISCSFAHSSGAWVRIGYVPSARNIADLPTRNTELPLPSRNSSSFGILGILRKWLGGGALCG